MLSPGLNAGLSNNAAMSAAIEAAATVTAAAPNYFRKVGLDSTGSVSTTGQQNANVVSVPETATTVAGNGDTFQVEEGTTFIANIGSFKDTLGSTSDYTADINWGDGTVSAGIVSATTGGDFAVIGTHEYAKSGTYTISVPVTDNTGAEITNTCSAQVIPSLSQSTVSAGASSFEAGGSTQVTLTVKNPSGDPESDGGLNVAFGLVEGSAGGSFGSVTGDGDGTYTATFTSTAAGVSTITASIDGQELSNDGYAVNVTPGPVSLSHSTLAVASPGVTIGAPDTVTFTARDVYGNQEIGGGLSVAFVQGGGHGRGLFTAAQDNGNGTYTATFFGTEAGTVPITATVAGGQGLSVMPAIMVNASSLPSPAVTWSTPAEITYGTARARTNSMPAQASRARLLTFPRQARCRPRAAARRLR